MKHLFKEIFFFAIVLSIAVFLPVQTFADWNTYIIEEQIDHGTSCGGHDRTAKTKSLEDQLDSDGWIGWRWIDEDSWPQDFKETTLNSDWQDDLYGDYSRVLMFSGHAKDTCRDLLFSHRTDGECEVNMEKEVRLGTMAGDEATLVIMMSCCVGRLKIRRDNWGKSKVKQVLAFSDLASYDSDSAKDFYNCTNTAINKTCWHDTMDIYNNSPSVYTRGINKLYAYTNHYGMRMKTGGCMGKADENLTYSYRSLTDNGESGLCKCD